MSYRGKTLVIEESHLYVNGAVIRDPVSLKTVNTQRNKSKAKHWCRRNGYSWMQPVKNVSLADLEEKI